MQPIHHPVIPLPPVTPISQALADLPRPLSQLAAESGQVLRFADLFAQAARMQAAGLYAQANRIQFGSLLAQVATVPNWPQRIAQASGISVDTPVSTTHPVNQ